MKTRIIYKSLSGNTEILAKRLGKILNCQIEPLQMNHQIEQCDVLFVGFWTDKGDCDEDVQAFLESLHNQRIFLFGTAGFGQQDTYFHKIINHVSNHLDDSNQVVGTYMCQGKMPMSVKSRYQKMLADNPDDDHLLGMIANFDNAFIHPNEEDLQKLEETVFTLTKE